MTNNHLSNSRGMIVKKMQVKIIAKNNSHPQEWSKWKLQTMTSIVKWREELECSHAAGGNVKGWSHIGKWFLKIVNIHMTQQFFEQAWTQKNKTWIRVTSLVTIAKEEKPKWQVTKKWIKKVQHTILLSYKEKHSMKTSYAMNEILSTLVERS